MIWLMKKIYLYQFAEQDAIKSLCEENLEGLKEEIINIKDNKLLNNTFFISHSTKIFLIINKTKYIYIHLKCT